MHLKECEKMVTTVQFGKEECHTMDEYETEWRNDDGLEAWLGEDEPYFAGTPEVVWND
jgi:hypothetical protein